jgi:hypothetical protein
MFGEKGRKCFLTHENYMEFKFTIDYGCFHALVFATEMAWP